MRATTIVLLLCAFVCLTYADNPMCGSGFVGDGTYCTDVSGTCVKKTVDPLVEKDPPVLLGATYTHNQLKISIGGPLVEARAYDTLLFEGGNCVWGDPESTLLWERSIDNSTITNCNDVFTITMNWNDHALCGFAPSGTTSTQQSFSGEITMKYTDNFILDEVNVQREHAIPFTVIVNFPTTVTIEVASVQINSTVVSYAALTGDSYDPISQTLTLVLTTVTNYPNMLATPIQLTYPGVVHLADSVDASSNPSMSGDCSAEMGGCQQAVTFYVQLQNGNCHFDGDYTVTENTVTCRDSPDCTHNDDGTQFTFTITSSDVCASITSTAKAAGRLQGFSDLATRDDVASFILGDSGYFGALSDTQNADGDYNTLIFTFTDITVLGTPARPLYTNGVITPDGEIVGLEVMNIVATGKAGSYFKVNFDGRVFKVPVSDHTTFTITATCSIVFDGNQKREVQMTFAADPQAIDASTRFNLAVAASPAVMEPTPAPFSNQAALIGGIVGGVAGVALLTVGIALLVRRYRTKAAANGLVNNSA